MRTFFATVQYGNPEILAASLEQRRLTRHLAVNDWVWDNFYPLKKQETAARVLVLCNSYGARRCYDDVLQSNIGLHCGFNALCSDMVLDGGLRDEDYIIVHDPDCFPITPGWDQALAHALTSDPNIAYACLNHPVSLKTPDRSYEQKWVTVEGLALDLRFPNAPCQFNITAWRWSFLKRVGGWDEPHKYYGGVESVMWDKARALGMKHCYLAEYKEDYRLCTMQDAIYHEYKNAHVGRTRQPAFDGSFEEYLKERGIK